jgi:ornithine cyclodeaminase/alanine dehydrogenase
MFKMKVINQEVCEKLLDVKSTIEIVEEVYRLKEKQEAGVWPMVFHEFERGVADMDIKSGYLKGDADIFGLKVVSWFGENPKKGLPDLVGTIMVLDSNTGVPKGILNAVHITGMRTGAAGAIGAKYLARKDSENLLMVGAGHQSRFQISSILSVMENIKTVRIYDPMNFDNAVKLSLDIKEMLKNEFLDKYEENSTEYKELWKRFDINFEAVENIEEATGLSDIIVSATPSRKPMIMKEWVKPGTHFSCVGSDMEGKQEIDENIFGVAKIYVDDMNQAVNVGETETSIKNGIISENDIIGEMGALILDKIKGRTSDADITIYDTTGIALQDLLTAKKVLELAEEKGLGEVIDI